jgi:hypothetical protein
MGELKLCLSDWAVLFDRLLLLNSYYLFPVEAMF